MKSSRSPLAVLGPVLGLLALALTAFALVYLVWLQPFYRGASYGPGHWRAWQDFPAVGWQSREATETVKGPIEVLSVQNVSGPITITRWDQDTVQVTYVKQARTEELLEQFEIEIAPRGRELSVRPLYRNVRSFAGSAFGSVSFDIRVPASVSRIKATNVSGRIQLQGLAADVTQDLQTVSGSIRTERSGDLRAQSVSGAVQFGFAGSNLNVSSTSGAIRGEILDLEQDGRVNVESISGSVELKAFEDLSAELDLSSVSGSISCDFPLRVREQKRTSLRATLGDGVVPFRVHTVSGSIRLSR